MKEFIESLKEMKRGYRLYVYSGVIYFLISGFLLVPFFSYLLNRLLLSAESGVLLNLDVFKILVSSRGILLFSLGFLVVILNIIVILGTQLILSHQKIHGVEVTITEAVLT